MNKRQKKKMKIGKAKRNLVGLSKEFQKEEIESIENLNHILTERRKLRGNRKRY